VPTEKWELITLTDGSAFLFDTRETTELAVEEMLKNKMNASKNASGLGFIKGNCDNGRPSKHNTLRVLSIGE
jgi:hypothetical protein